MPRFRDALPFFLVQLVVVQLLVCALILWFQFHFKTHPTVGWLANMYFTIFTVLIYLSAWRSISRASGRVFISLVMGGSGIKMAGAILVMMVRHLFFSSFTNSEVVLFLIIYVLFTIFETTALMKLSKS
jgi:hypothetical protein